ncbi:AEC family transporter [Bradyrhizobium frederickii]|uniref:AEC family transporter n=1 Tax=Bradyrhizobium frederickii TaxID=2560054 RepID=UPI001F419EDB|nr:AEC family transporter [Bradyrhizobium frederickii]
MCALKLAVMPAAAFVLAKLLDLPPLAAGVVVLFAAMPTGANAYIFAVQYQRLVNPVSGAVALGTLLAAVTLPVGGVGGGGVSTCHYDPDDFAFAGGHGAD